MNIFKCCVFPRKHHSAYCMNISKKLTKVANNLECDIKHMKKIYKVYEDVLITKKDSTKTKNLLSSSIKNISLYFPGLLSYRGDLLNGLCKTFILVLLNMDFDDFIKKVTEFLKKFDLFYNNSQFYPKLITDDHHQKISVLEPVLIIGSKSYAIGLFGSIIINNQDMINNLIVIYMTYKMLQIENEFILFTALDEEYFGVAKKASINIPFKMTVDQDESDDEYFDASLYPNLK